MVVINPTLSVTMYEIGDQGVPKNLASQTHCSVQNQAKIHRPTCFSSLCMASKIQFILRIRGRAILVVLEASYTSSLRAPSLLLRVAMAPHLTAAELDELQTLSGAGMTTAAIHKRLVSTRRRRGLKAPTIDNVRLALSGKTYKRGRVEARGRKKKMTPKRIQKVCARINLGNRRSRKFQVLMLALTSMLRAHNVFGSGDFASVVTGGGAGNPIKDHRFLACTQPVYDIPTGSMYLGSLNI